MPIVMRAVYEPDDLDDKQFRSGWVSADLATELYGYSHKALRAMACSGSVNHEKLRGRDFYSRSDLEIRKQGGFPSEHHKAEQQEANRMCGYVPSPNSPRDVESDPLIDFMRDFGG